MRPEALQVCQRLMVVSNCMPGSPQTQVASAIIAHQLAGPEASPPPRRSCTARVSHQPSSSTARMNSSVTRTELLAFWNKMDS